MLFMPIGWLWAEYNPDNELVFGLRAPVVPVSPRGLTNAADLTEALGDKGECVTKLIEMLKADRAVAAETQDMTS